MPIWESLGTGGLGAISNLIQTGINSKVARENTDKTIAANKYLAEYQYSKDLEMWNRGNVYNSPMEQMRRLKAAGLNPNMVYGSGSAAGMSAGALPKYNAPTVDYNYQPSVDIPGAIGAFQDFALKSAQIRNTDELAKGRTEENRVLDALQEFTSDEGFFRGTIRQGLGGAKLRAAIANALRAGQKTKVGGQIMGYQVDSARETARRLSNDNARIIELTKNLNLRNEYFAAEAIAGLFGKSMTGLGAMRKLFGKEAGRALPKAATKGGTVKAAKRGVDPLNKAWQKEFESHKQWMQRVNPGAK